MPDRTARQREVEAIQELLAAVHAALWGYGALTPHLSDSDTARAREIYDVYRKLRRRLTRMISDQGGEPVAAAAAYDLPFPVDDESSARELAAHLESRCAMACGVMVTGAVHRRRRAWGAELLEECTRRAIEWGDTLEAFPGMA